ncbi:hypothetical protein RHE_PF00259 (plasmid) [Rhizobium etli CFN 42]|uniref:Uncharacterized protein n=1 Tax=Rhizobium etli (strain ATCC 51251 / DSM 11541 / JCM 21823 / NBRC 15573 / CFN 42) TaxID=347834 RepID=Q2JZ37_RHIEC|nr:hypothetical protein RHE_PF00259 [Rhizobium etli CFN 42]
MSAPAALGLGQYALRFCASEIPPFEQTLVDRLRGRSVNLEQIRGGKHLDQSCGEVIDIGLPFIEELDGGAAQDLAVVFAHRDAEMAIPTHNGLRQASEILR